MAFFQLAFEKQEEMNQPLVTNNRFPFNNQITTIVDLTHSGVLFSNISAYTMFLELGAGDKHDI